MACSCIDLAFQDVYRGAQWLVENGYLVKLTRVRLQRRAGSRPVMYGLPCVTDEEVARGILRVQAFSSPAYAVVARLVQRVWEDVVDEEVQYSKILEHARGQGRGFDFTGLAEMAARELQGRGVKVWR